jgi:hypothetical protein
MVSGSVLFRGLIMKTYAQFFNYSTGYIEGTMPPKFDDSHKKLIEACGDRGIVQIDSRLANWRIGSIARETCQARGYDGYQILQGDSLLNAKPVSGVWPVPKGKNDTSAMSATYGA